MKPLFQRMLLFASAFILVIVTSCNCNKKAEQAPKREN